MLTYIAGSGGMGSRFGAQIHESGHDVILLDAWDKHVEAVQENGLEIVGDNPRNVKVTMMHPEDATEKADVIVVFTKSMQLDNMLQSVEHLVKDDTRVVCLLNGLGHDDTMKKYLPEKNIIMGVTVWTAGMEGPGKVLLNDSGTVTMSSLLPEGKEGGQEVVDMFNDAGLNAIYDENVMTAIWRKACVNGTLNPNCTITDTTCGEFGENEWGEEIIRVITKEFSDVAHAVGVELDFEETVQYILDTIPGVARHYPSMHQDLIKNHRKTEIDYLNGYVARKGEELGVDTPYSAYITDLIHIKEKMLVK